MAEGSIKTQNERDSNVKEAELWEESIPPRFSLSLLCSFTVLIENKFRVLLMKSNAECTALCAPHYGHVRSVHCHIKYPLDLLRL